ncbi:MAG: hypothetical protein JWO98_3566 [Frankiales bacterium]|nr:hypothetical protein [Frankiales bacterium]
MNPTIGRLAEAVNRHDPEGMAAQMAPDYRSEQPAHPNRGFGGTAGTGRPTRCAASSCAASARTG